MKTSTAILLATILLAFGVQQAQAETNPDLTVQGWITDSAQRSLEGVSVIILDHDTMIVATQTDRDGYFRLNISDARTTTIDVRVSSIGYRTVLRSVVADGQPVLHLALESIMIDIPGIVVRPVVDRAPNKTSVTKDDIDRRSHHSAIPTNPISAIVQPNAAREGSQHSSKIRVNGSVPDYHINGVNVGADPSHYGAFSIIPSSVISELRFRPQGTDASMAVPSSIDFRTPQRFENHLDGDFDLSLIEATGSLSLGTSRTFLLGSLRKSVLDKLVHQLEVESDRRTLPPTNFQDVFLSAGWKIAPNWVVVLDQYHVQDFLSYVTTHTAQTAGGVNMFQHTKESYFGARLHHDLGWSAIAITASARQGKEIYRAHPNSVLATGQPAFSLNLSERRRSWMMGLEADTRISKTLTSLVAGVKLAKIDKRQTDMQQVNWNFLPPDATSDNPQPYQTELNLLHGAIDKDGNETNLSGYCSATFDLGSTTLISGLRLDRYSALSKAEAVTFRNDLTVPVGDNQKLHMFLGSFAENPVGRILQPYQVLIRNDLAQLTPQKTYLASASYQRGALSLGVFGKMIRNQPVLRSDFDFVVNDGSQATVQNGFLSMRSEGRSNFVGGNITMESANFLNSGVEVYGFYSFSRAVKADGQVSVPYELDAPHRLVIQSNYRISERFTVGADLGLRSGNPYTPLQGMISADTDRYTEAYDQATREVENSARFPVSASFDLHGRINIGSVDLYLNVANVTNRSNPIINTADGFVYDAGILPSLGLRYQL
jgi:hypothetical protein